jgi:hypothetical protein
MTPENIAHEHKQVGDLLVTAITNPILPGWTAAGGSNCMYKICTDSSENLPVDCFIYRKKLNTDGVQDWFDSGGPNNGSTARIHRNG